MPTVETEAFRAQVRAWVEKNAPEGIRNPKGSLDVTCWGGRHYSYVSEDQKIWLDRCAEQGWTVPTWPEPYGGAGLTPEQGRIVEQEFARIGAKRPLDNHGIWMLGPALLKYGSEAQKRHFLPQIARGEIRWAQGYSEPEAGSDLANIKTRGVIDGDYFIVNGSKLWSTYAHESDWLFALVRTEPDASKHAGISFLLIDLDSPGIEVSSYELINGQNHFAQIFFDDVRVPISQVVGGRGQGWEVTRYLLQHERAMIGERAQNPQAGKNLFEVARQRQGDSIEPSLLERVADVELDRWAFDIWLERIRDQAKAGEHNPVSASALKVFGTELGKRRSEVLLSLEGADGLVNESSAADAWLSWPMSTVGGGTTEIQLNIIAKRALGLPGT